MAPKHNLILCPVDLSENSFGAIELATMLAEQRNSKIAFYYVTPVWEPGGSSQLQEYAKQFIEHEKMQLYKVRPTSSAVEFEHHFIHGNPAAELVKATKKADLIVMSTHGRSGIVRLIMGSIANFVLRNAKCPAVLVKGNEIAKDESEQMQQSVESQTYVTEVMHPVPPVHAFETMDSVLNDLTKARETAAPVVNESGKCIGILTTSDIEKFHSLQKRFDEKDESVINEMFEVNKYGQCCTDNYNFDQVERHMTKEVISLSDSDSVQVAIDLFKSNPKIHHLIVVDEDDQPVGIIDAARVFATDSSPNERRAVS
jgi:nucleotide-binding universal stress UspA family protein